MYIRIAFSIELRLRVSRSPRSLANLRSWLSFVSQNEEVRYSRQEKSYKSELVTQIFMILGYLNFTFSVVPVV